MTFIRWTEDGSWGPISHSLKINGNTVKYTQVDEYKDMDSVTTQICGLQRGREYYRQLKARLGHPKACYSRLPQ